MKRLTYLIAATLTALLLQGCTDSANVRVDFDTQENFQKLHTYAWAPMTAEEEKAKSANSLVHERIQTAVDSYLGSHGYQKVKVAQADFLVTHTVTVEDRTQVRDTRMTVGYGRYGDRGGVGISYGMPIEPSVTPYKFGTLIIDIINLADNRLVWRGSGERAVSGQITLEKSAEIINKTVNEILSRFPPDTNGK